MRADAVHIFVLPGLYAVATYKPVELRNDVNFCTIVENSSRVCVACFFLSICHHYFPGQLAGGLGLPPAAFWTKLNLSRGHTCLPSSPRYKHAFILVAHRRQHFHTARRFSSDLPNSRSRRFGDRTPRKKPRARKAPAEGRTPVQSTARRQQSISTESTARPQSHPDLYTCVFVVYTRYEVKSG